jgi:hypothetical protein
VPFIGALTKGLEEFSSASKLPCRQKAVAQLFTPARSPNAELYGELDGGTPAVDLRMPKWRGRLNANTPC